MLIKKICGITNIQDALLCAESGATHLGFIFAESSPRKVSPEQAKEISRELSAQFNDDEKIKFTAVLADNTEEELRAIVKSGVFDVLQLHSRGGLSENLFSGIAAEYNLEIWPVLKIQQISDFYEAEKYRKNYDFFLLDSRQGKQSGGSGKVFNWNLISDYFFSATQSPFNYILAGGINENSLEDIIKRIKTGDRLFTKFAPVGFDISSGVELFPGKKDEKKVKKVLEQIHIIEGLMKNE